MKVIVVALTFLLLAGCSSQKVYNVVDQPVIDFENKLTQARLEKLIMIGAINKKWVPKKIKSGHIVAEIRPRSHYAAVDIFYTDSNYSIKYRDSDRLDYNANKDTIHKGYNRWIMNLQNSIDRAITRDAIGQNPASGTFVDIHFGS